MEIAKSGKIKNNKCKKIFRTNNQDATVSKLLVNNISNKNHFFKFFSNPFKQLKPVTYDWL